MLDIIHDQPELAPDKKPNWTSSKVGKLLAGATLALEVNPITNDVARYAALGLTLKATGDPVLAAAVYGGSTLAYEGIGGVVAADVLDSAGAQKAVNKVNQVLDKVGASRLLHANAMTEAAVALYAGTPAVTFLKHRQNPERTREQNRRYAAAVSLGISAVCSAEGFVIAEGIEAPSPLTISLAVLGAGSFVASWRWARRRLSSARAVEIIKSTQSIDNIPAEADTTNAGSDKNSDSLRAEIRYDLSEEELRSLELDLVQDVKERFGEDGIYAAWLRPHHKYANIVRTSEAKYFPEVESISEEEEDRTLLLALVDTRPFANRVVQGATVSGISYKDDHEVIERPDARADTTGFIVVDQLIDMGNFTRQEFHDYYTQKGVDLEKSIAVETNLRIGPKTERFNGLRPAQLAYLAIFNRLEKRHAEMHHSAVFTTVNRPSVLSFQHFGLQYEPLMGRNDLVTPESELGLDFLPIAIPYNEENLATFQSIGFELPEMIF